MSEENHSNEEADPGKLMINPVAQTYEQQRADAAARKHIQDALYHVKKARECSSSTAWADYGAGGFVEACRIAELALRRWL